MGQGRICWGIGHCWGIQMFLSRRQGPGSVGFLGLCPSFQGWGPTECLGLLSSILCWPRVEKTEREAASCARLSSCWAEGLGKECEDCWAGAECGEGARPCACLSPCFLFGPRSLWESGCLGSRWASCLSPQTLLDFGPWKSSSRFLGKLWEALWRCWKWHPAASLPGRGRR